MILSKLLQLKPKPSALFAIFLGEKIPAYLGMGPSDPEPCPAVFYTTGF